MPMYWLDMTRAPGGAPPLHCFCSSQSSPERSQATAVQWQLHPECCVCCLWWPHRSEFVESKGIPVFISQLSPLTPQVRPDERHELRHHVPGQDGQSVSYVVTCPEMLVSCSRLCLHTL